MAFIIPTSLVFGNTEIKPTATEAIVFGVGISALCYGLWTGKNLVAGSGGLAVGAVCYRFYEKAEEVKDPDTFNGYFITGGRASAMQGLAGAGKVRRVLGLPGARGKGARRA